ncbi:MAG: DUF998 domain-containing protein [Thermoplasmatota archaeon]
MSPSSLVRRRQRLATVGLVSIAVFVAALVVLHATARGRLPSHMSQFANSPYGLFWALALYCLILGTSTLVWALGPCLRDGLSKRAGIAMLALAGIGAILLATFPTDAVRPYTWKGTLHDDAAATTFMLIAGAMVVLTPALRSSQAFSRFSILSFILGILAIVSLTLYLLATVNGWEGKGVAQRVLVSIILSWFAMLALRLWRAGPEEPMLEATRRVKPAAKLA